jgi:hypothetical protein
MGRSVVSQWPGQDSNLRTTDYESAALTTELPGRVGSEATTGRGPGGARRPAQVR